MKPYFLLTQNKVDEIGGKYGFAMKDITEWYRSDKVGKLALLKHNRKKWRTVQEFISKMSKVKENYRKQNPEMDVLLNKWDYVSTPVTQEAADWELNRLNKLPAKLDMQDLTFAP